MRASGAGVFDASTAVSRPVQRCVKYPLFLSEIAKYTALTHPDHPKLMEAVKQLSHLGSKMNESKRRKELTRKYTEEQSNTSLGDKLSKFTVHSIKKKTNRFTYRMGSSLGVVKLVGFEILMVLIHCVKVTRDADFDRLVCDLDQAERRLVRFNYMLKSDFMSKFKDFEALNNQVKQTLPKVIDVLNSVSAELYDGGDALLVDNAFSFATRLNVLLNSVERFSD
ncbi:hypothetical protein TELCIR_05882 [Teladorsagia circumcincta]|uniref:DH domain-containing protein n=1 Tax=Teladorsagia circumcincta TaxID=45464 RepID=A0A2G9UR69_TELCI|nr:hypothetical protein TELCIR_05882 [Teladorsagia circumcincta]